MDDKDYLNWGNLGEAYYLGGDRAGATQAFRRAIELAQKDLKVNPRDPQVLKDLADYHAMTNDRTDALRYLDLALKESRFDKEYLLAAALVYKHLGETGLSLEWLGKALRAGYSANKAFQQPDLDNLHGDPRFQDLLKSSSSGPNLGK